MPVRNSSLMLVVCLHRRFVSATSAAAVQAHDGVVANINSLPSQRFFLFSVFSLSPRCGPSEQLGLLVNPTQQSGTVAYVHSLLHNYSVMSRARFNIPDLDVLDSPLVSPMPMSLSGIPGSALAERIFNDPESWEDTDADDSDIPEDISADDQFEWLAEEIEKVVNAFHSPSTPTDGKAIDLFPETPVSASPQKNRLSAAGLKRMGKRASVRPISLAALFEHSTDNFSGDVQQQLSKILESSGIPYHVRPYPPSSALSPLSTSGTSSTLDSLSTASTIASSSGEMSPSPVIVNSASATLSFLEWYGIYPDSPLLRPKSARLKAPLLKLQVPSPKPALRSSPLITPASTTSTIVPPHSKRSSPAPPPGLEPPVNTTPAVKRNPSPPGLSRSPSPFKASDYRSEQVHKRSESPARLNVSNERGRTLHMTAPPAYSREPSPVIPFSRSNSTTVSRPLRDPTPVRGMSQDQPIRRLPSIPSETTSSRPSTPPQPLPQPPVQTEPKVQPQAPQPPPRMPSRTASPAPANTKSSPSRQSSAHQADFRPMSVRSPPMGPRTRGRASQDSHTRPLGPMGHRPPVLRL
ncbi:hypothetical protein CPB84DRAFT_1768310 [Gymnopilus junonius]|uniref:Uncharacterized protein n=1 Tax=Gymnopilus junonius TaxID=109634 RepID=A0A9P5NSG4_GYMJU|nr:hypothetical protein CPB84DRAFT_1768310 [Gymnopilus junonius]